LSRLFISHSSKNDDWAIALRDWLTREGWNGEDDIFLDLDPERGIAAGQRWVHALEDAASRCEAVLFLVSEDWLASKWCHDEYQLANKLNKKRFALLIDEIALDRLPGGMTAQWQVAHLRGEPAERFVTVHPLTRRPSPVHVAEAGLNSLKRGLEKAGIGPQTFELQPDPAAPFGWRPPYRGLEALEPEDAAVFFGRSADIVRGVDALRGLAARKPPRLLVVLGDSGTGKSSFLRAGLWPRLLRDDSQWLALKPVRAGRGGAIEGAEGLLAALEEVHRRFALPASRADLRQNLATPEGFTLLLGELRQAAARRALLSEPPHPLPVLCLDQGEELFAPDAGPEAENLLRLARAAIEGDVALLLVTIRSDSYGRMQGAKTLAGIDQVPLSLGPVPQGEIARIIREPAEILRRKAGPSAPVFAAAVVERLQTEIEGEADALPLLAFVLQRLMREHAGRTATIGLDELEQTGGVAAALESEAEAALADAGYGPDRAQRREALRRLFIPRLARIDRGSKAPQRRIARQGELPADLLPLARALTERRLLVTKLAARAEDDTETKTATLEVAHEALLRRWPTLADLLAEDRDALLLLDGTLLAATDWNRAEASRKPDFLSHRGSRLSDALALSSRGPDWEREIAPARAYLAACQSREAAEREEREAALKREQERLAEMAAAQAQTARTQRRARRALTTLAAVVILGLGLGVWQQIQLGRANSGLSAEQATSSRRQAQLDHAQKNLADAEAANKQRQSELDRVQADLASTGAESDRRQAQLDHAQKNLALAEAANKQRQSELDRAQADLARIGAESNRRQEQLDYAQKNLAVAEAAIKQRQTELDRAQRDLVKATAEIKQRKEQLDRAEADLKIEQAENKRRQIQLDRGQVNLLAELATSQRLGGALDTGLRLSVHAARLGLRFDNDAVDRSLASSALAASVWQADWRLMLGGHEDYVKSAAFNRDGSRIVTASGDGTARIWDAGTGREIAVLRGHERWVGSAVFSPDGSRIVTASGDHTARIWDAVAGRQIAILRGHEATVTSAVFSPDGSRIVTASGDDTARVWDSFTGKQIAVLRGHESWVGSAALSPDGSRILTASMDRTARIWDAATAKQIAVLRGHDEIVESAAFSRDGSRIVTASSDYTARIWDAAMGKQMAILRGSLGNHIYLAAFSPDGSRVVTSTSQTSNIWDAATGKEIAELVGPSASFSPDGSRIVTASSNKVVTISSDKAARIWDAATGKEMTVLRGHGNQVRSAAFSPDGSRIVTASSDNTARIWNAATGREIAVLRGDESRASYDTFESMSSDFRKVNSAVFNSDGQRIVTASNDRTARIWNSATNMETGILRGHKNSVLCAAFSPDGSRIVTTSWDYTARIWDADTGREMVVLYGHASAVNSAAFNPNGSRIVTASRDKTVRIWDAKTGQETMLIRGHKEDVTSAVFSPDGLRIVTASWDKTARIWDAATGNELIVLRGHERFVESVAFSSDGSRIVTASSDYTARIWDAATGKEINVLRGHEDTVKSAAFSRDGSRIVTASHDETAGIWNAATGKQIAILRGHRRWVNSAAFNPDGSRIVTASVDETAIIWDARFATMSTTDLVAEVCLRRLRGLTTLSRDEMRLAGYSDDTPQIDVCAGFERDPPKRVGAP
jgi:WD40 repeat protein